MYGFDELGNIADRLEVAVKTEQQNQIAPLTERLICEIEDILTRR